MSDRRPLAIIPYGTFNHSVHERAATHHRIIKAQLELTYRCNLHCRHCYTDPCNAAAFFPRELTLAEIHRLLSDMRELGVIWLNLTGGDIFMRPDFFDIYESAVDHGFLLQLYTNGTLFTRAIIERLQTHPPFSIDISCHSVEMNHSSTGSRRCPAPIAPSFVELSCCAPAIFPFPSRQN